MGTGRVILLAALVLAGAGCDGLSGLGGPRELTSFGYVRPASCERRGPRSYNCIMKNYLDGLREVRMECASFDAQGRMIGSTNRVHALSGSVLSPGEERVAVVYHEDGADSIVCADVENSILPYAEAMALASNERARDIVTVLKL